MNIKSKYSRDIRSFRTERLFITYNNIVKLKGSILDIGCGDGKFVETCKSKGLKASGFDYNQVDLEKDKFPEKDNSYDFITLNAVIEHVKNYEHLLSECYRVLKKDGYIIIRTPNFKLDFKNFYNDITHITPYTPERLNMLFKLFSMKVIFNEPGIICKSKIWLKLPFKWKICSIIPGGTKSIIAVAKK